MNNITSLTVFKELPINETTSSLVSVTVTASSTSSSLSMYTNSTILLTNITGDDEIHFTGRGNATSSAGIVMIVPGIEESSNEGTVIISGKAISVSWTKACAIAIFLCLVFTTVIGNTLVILSVLTTRRLRTVTNCFVMNLAITDWLVGIFVMPPAVVFYIVGSWQFGWILCDIWISLDVLLCTASILSLCAISLDRYLAIIQPLTYSKKRRSKRLALLMIFVVWIVAIAITCPPFFGWYEPGRRNAEFVDCRYNQNKGYVVFSAMGSFFIPLSVMLYVYLKIGYVLSSRRQRITLTEASEKSPDTDAFMENYIPDTDHVHCSPHWVSLKNLMTKNLGQDALYELVEVTKSQSTTMQCSTISCKYAAAIKKQQQQQQQNQQHQQNETLSNHNDGAHEVLPLRTIHFCETHTTSTSISESKLTTSKYKFQQHPNQSSQQVPGIPSGGSIISGINSSKYHNNRVPMRISTLKRDTKTAKTLTMVMGGFIACWLPFFIYYILIPFLPKEAVSETLMSFFTWVGWVNCAINPFIYAFYSPDFRAAFWRLTCRKLCHKQNNFDTFKS